MSCRVAIGLREARMPPFAGWLTLQVMDPRAFASVVKLADRSRFWLWVFCFRFCPGWLVVVFRFLLCFPLIIVCPSASFAWCLQWWSVVATAGPGPFVNRSRWGRDTVNIGGGSFGLFDFNRSAWIRDGSHRRRVACLHVLFVFDLVVSCSPVNEGALVCICILTVHELALRVIYEMSLRTKSKGAV